MITTLLSTFFLSNNKPHDRQDQVRPGGPCIHFKPNLLAPAPASKMHEPLAHKQGLLCAVRLLQLRNRHQLACKPHLTLLAQNATLCVVLQIRPHPPVNLLRRKGTKKRMIGLDLLVRRCQTCLCRRKGHSTPVCERAVAGSFNEGAHPCTSCIASGSCLLLR